MILIDSLVKKPSNLIENSRKKLAGLINKKSSNPNRRQGKKTGLKYQ